MIRICNCIDEFCHGMFHQIDEHSFIRISAGTVQHRMLQNMENSRAVLWYGPKSNQKALFNVLIVYDDDLRSG